MKRLQEPFRNSKGEGGAPRCSPYLRLSHDYQIPAGQGRLFAKERLGDHALHYFLQGEGVYILDGGTYDIEPRSVFLVRPGHGYRFELRDGVEARMLNIHFDWEEIELSHCPFPCPDTHWKDKTAIPMALPSAQSLLNFPAYENAFRRLHESALLNSEGAALRRKAALLEIVALLYDNASMKSSGETAWSHRQALDKAIQAINEAPNGKFDLDGLSKAAGISRALLCRVFRESTGLSPQKYITGKRVELASAELLYGRTPIKEIAIRCGFSDVHHFTRIFKKSTGITPGKFRERQIDIYE